MEAEAAAATAVGGGVGGDGWSWEDNKMFEVALVTVVEEEDPERYWERVAAMIGGGRRKSAEEVKRHYEDLLEDLHSIESGRLDHELFAAPVINDGGDTAACCTDGGQE